MVGSGDPATTGGATAKEAVKIFRRLVGDVVPVALKPAVVKQTLANGVERLVSSSAKILPENIMGGTGTTAAARELTRPDDAGHIFARLLGGQGGATSDNIFAQLPAVNRGPFRDFEALVAKEVIAGKNVFVKVEFVYPTGTAVRPSEIKWV